MDKEFLKKLDEALGITEELTTESFDFLKSRARKWVEAYINKKERPKITSNDMPGIRKILNDPKLNKERIWIHTAESTASDDLGPREPFYYNPHGGSSPSPASKNARNEVAKVAKTFLRRF